MERLKVQLDDMCSSTEASIEDAAQSGSGALIALQAQHSSYTSSAQQVLTRVSDHCLDSMADTVASDMLTFSTSSLTLSLYRGKRSQRLNS